MNYLYFGILVGLFVVLVFYKAFSCGNNQRDNYRPKNFIGNALIITESPSSPVLDELEYPYNFSDLGRKADDYSRHQYASHKRRYNFKNHQNNYR